MRHWWPGTRHCHAKITFPSNGHTGGGDGIFFFLSNFFDPFNDQFIVSFTLNLSSLYTCYFLLHVHPRITAINQRYDVSTDTDMFASESYNDSLPLLSIAINKIRSHITLD